MLVCAFFCAHCTRDRGCSVHPAFPAPSDLLKARRYKQNPGESRRGIAEVRVLSVVILSVVIARLDRTPSIPETAVIESRSPGVLDTPHAGG
jgi:hypothetical protein